MDALVAAEEKNSESVRLRAEVQGLQNVIAGLKGQARGRDQQPRRFPQRDE